jgi:hypothetical protein
MAIAALVGTLAGAPALSAQADPAPTPRAEGAGVCRCLDEQGRERERCFCFVMPDRFAGLIGPRRAVLGVNIRHDQPARYDEQGARLYGVDGTSPAGEAGLEAGDVLASVDGRSLLDPLPDEQAEERLSDDASLPVQRLLALLADHEPGDSLRLEYLRDGERREATVVLEEPGFLRPGAPPAIALGPMGEMRMFGPEAAGPLSVFRPGGDCPGGATGAARSRGLVVGFGRSCVAGVELIEMRTGLAEYFGASAGGVLVADAREDSPLGLRAGDVLLAVDGREVRGADHALRMLRSYEADEEVALRVLRRQETLELRGRVR